jgi:basic membrane protein A
MRTKIIWRLIALLTVIFMLAACAGSQATEEPAQQPAVEEPAEEEPAEEPEAEEAAEEPAMEAPTELRIAGVLATGLENSWDLSWVESVERVKELKPHDLDISLVYTEGVWGDDAAQVIRGYAESGQYDIIWGHSSFSDLIAEIKDDYPEILFVYTGSGNEALGGNGYWVYKRIHEPAYLEGMLAGLMTKSNVLGAVGTFAFDDVNDVINAFKEGAKEVNPDIQLKVTFIESWYDPAKAMEATTAQAAAGADYLLQLGEIYEACEQNEIYCFGNYIDSNFLSPDTVVTSHVAYWDPEILWVIDEWWNHKTTGEPYDAPLEGVWFSMAEGGSDLAPFHGFEDVIPADVMDEVMQKKADIMSGAFEVPLNVEPPVSD